MGFTFYFGSAGNDKIQYVLCPQAGLAHDWQKKEKTIKINRPKIGYLISSPSKDHLAKVFDKFEEMLKVDEYSISFEGFE